MGLEKKRLFGKFGARRATPAVTSISVETPAWLREVREMNRKARDDFEFSQAAERAALLERDHFDKRHVDNARVHLLYRAVIAGKPFEIGSLAGIVADSGPGKYDRAALLAALMVRAVEVGKNSARTGGALASPPAEIAPQLRKVRRFGDDIDSAFEYAVTGQCSVLDRSRRVFAVVYIHMSNQYEITRRRMAEALPPPIPSPLSIAAANPDAGRLSPKRPRGAAGMEKNQRKGVTTRDNVLAVAAKHVAVHGKLPSASAIAAKVKKSQQHVGRLLREPDAQAEIGRRASAIQGSEHSKNTNMPF